MACAWTVTARVCAALVALLAGVAPAWGQDPTRAGAGGGGGDVLVGGAGSAGIIDGHGWLTLRQGSTGTGAQSGGASGRVILEHLPPRFGNESDLNGVVRRATEFDVGVGGAGVETASGVDGIAWAGASVYMVLPEERLETPQRHVGRRVLMLTASRVLGTNYEYVPAGRARVLPTLASAEGGSDVAGVGAPGGDRSVRLPLVVLLVDRPKDATMAVRRGGRLMGLRGDEWGAVETPWDKSLAPEPVWMIADGRVRAVAGATTALIQWRDGVALAMEEPGKDVLTIWVGKVSGGNEEGPARLEWSKEERPLTGPNLGEETLARPLTLAFVEGASPAADALLDLTFGADGKREGRLVSLLPSGPAVMASLAGVPAPPASVVVPMSAPGTQGFPLGRLALVWRVRGPDGPERVMVREISATTGVTLYSSAARSGEHEGRRRLQALTIVGVLVMVGVLVFVLRGPAVKAAEAGGSSVGLEEARRWSPARVGEPLRRLGAAALDYAPSAILVSILIGRDATALLTPTTMLGGTGAMSGDLDLGPFGLAVAATILHTSVLEWLFGRSVGKFVLGLRVVDARKLGEERPAEEAAGGKPEAVRMDAAALRPRLWQAVVRNVVRWCVPLLAMFALLDEAGRHPGDLSARTLVVADENDGS